MLIIKLALYSNYLLCPNPPEFPGRLGGLGGGVGCLGGAGLYTVLGGGGGSGL